VSKAKTVVWLDLKLSILKHLEIRVAQKLTTLGEIRKSLSQLNWLNYSILQIVSFMHEGNMNSFQPYLQI
jgi:hypothetical protein